MNSGYLAITTCIKFLGNALPLKSKFVASSLHDDTWGK